MKQAVILYYLGPVAINSVVVTTWGIMLLLAIFCWLATRRLSPDPGPLQTALEGMVSAIYDAIHAVLPAKAKLVLPFIARSYRPVPWRRGWYYPRAAALALTRSGPAIAGILPSAANQLAAP